MVVQLRSLEKALEEFINRKNPNDWESLVDSYLDENASISSSASAKLHEMLYKMWLNDETLRQSRDNRKDVTGSKKAQSLDNSSSKFVVTPNITPNLTPSLTPITSNAQGNMANSVTDSVTQSENGSIVSITESANTSHISQPDPRVYFLQGLNRLAPCLINKEQLEQWWVELAGYAIDSSGHRLDVSDQAVNFIKGVVSGSFYEYSDSTQSELVKQNSLLFGRNVLETYLSIKKLSSSPVSDERVRFIRQNCRTLFVIFAQRSTFAAFSILNEYFIFPKYRHQLLDLVVECFSECQNSKLFKVYDTPFFESLLTCLEQDKSRIIIQLAINALAMIIVHICHKLTTNNLLFRVYGIFGRACSWQSTKTKSLEKQRQSSFGEEEIGNIEQAAKNVENSQRIDQEPTAESVVGSTDEANSGTKENLWEVYEEEEDETGDWVTPEIDTVKIISLFTFLYGLFPINTLLFCHQCDEYLSKHKYQRRFKDYWSRFMVTGKTERIIRQFRVDPLLVVSNEYAEIDNAVQRFQKIGSALALSTICMSRRVIELGTHIQENGANNGSNNTTGVSEAVAAAHVESDGDKKSSMTDFPVNNMDALNISTLSMHSTPDDLLQQQYLDNHELAFQMQTNGSAGHWYRELLLMRNELAFANFARDTSEQRAIRWQKRAFNHSVTMSKNEELVRQNKILRSKVQGLEAEAQKAVRSARTIMRERSAYESKLLNRNREFRDKVGEFGVQLEELKKVVESSQASEKVSNTLATEANTKLAILERQLTSIKGEYGVVCAKLDAVKQGEQINPETLVEAEVAKQEITSLKFTIQRMDADHAKAVEALKHEVNSLQKHLASVIAKVPSSSSRGFSPNASVERSSSLASTSPPSIAHVAGSSSEVNGTENHKSALQAIANERNAVITRLRSQNDDLSRRCVNLEHELRARKVHEEERLNELQAALSSSRSYIHQDVLTENKFKGRGGAQGVPRRQTQL